MDALAGDTTPRPDPTANVCEPVQRQPQRNARGVNIGARLAR